jgi:hypothetical protein
MRQLLLLAVVTAPAVAQVPAVRLIAAPEAASKQQFGAVPAVRQLPGGKLLVNDIAKRQLTLLDPSLQSAMIVADSVSGSASSYGTAPGGLIAYTGDSTLFVDPAGLSMFVIDPSGRIARVASVPRSQDARTIANNINGVAGLDAQGRLVYRGGLVITRANNGRGGSGGGNAGSPLVGIPDFPDTTPLLRIDLATRKLDTVAYFKTPKVKMNMVKTDNGFSMTSETNPMPIVDDWAVLSDGTIAIVRGQDYHVDFIGADGALRSSAKIPYEWQRLSDDDKVAVIDSAKKQAEAMRTAIANGQGANGAAAIGGAPRVVMNFSTADGGGPPRIGTSGAATAMTDFVSPSELPDYRPVFGAGGSVRADLDGNLWVRTSAVRAGASAGPIYDVINAKGELVDRVQIPAGRQIVGFGPGGIVYMAARDASGAWVERTRR